MFFPDVFNKDKWTHYQKLNRKSFRKYKRSLPWRRGDRSSGQRGPVSLPFQAVGQDYFSPLLGTGLFLLLHSWLSRLVGLPNLEVATEQTLTVHGCPAVNSPRGSGPGYITGTSINPSRSLPRPYAEWEMRLWAQPIPSSLKRWHPSLCSIPVDFLLALASLSLPFLPSHSHGCARILASGQCRKARVSFPLHLPWCSTHCCTFQGQISRKCAKTETELKTGAAGRELKKHPLPLTSLSLFMGLLQSSSGR